MAIERLFRRRAFSRNLLGALILIAGPLGCGEEGVTETTIRKTVTVEKLPEVVLKAAQKKLPDVKFSEAFENLEKGVTLQSYEVKGRDKKGKIREVRVSLTGEILEVE